MELEKEYYTQLVQDGGRPLYPVSQLEQVASRPQDFRGILRFWQHVPTKTPIWQGVFARQLERWREFRKWQVDKRRQQNRITTTNATGRSRSRYSQPSDPVEVLGATSTQYAEAVNSRLVCHGQQKAELGQDPQQQDALTTWLEYLSFEYWWYDNWLATLELQRPKYEKAWRALKSSGILRPPETRASLNRFDLACRATNAGTRQKVVVSTFLKYSEAFQRLQSKIGRQAMLLEWVVSQVPLIASPSEHKRGTKRTRDGSKGDNGGKEGDDGPQKRVRFNEPRILKQPQSLRRSSRIAARYQLGERDLHRHVDRFK